MSLKKNQSNLYEEVETVFSLESKNHFKGVQDDIHTTIEKGRGRIEKRTCTVFDVGRIVSRKDDWAGLKSLVFINLERKIRGK